MAFWRRTGLVCAIGAATLLAILHFMPHGLDLSPVHHWLSEYVLSGSVAARSIMHVAFLLLSGAAFAVAMLRKDASRYPLLLAAIALAAMTFCDTYANDGRHRAMWPLTAGNVHQYLLYAAIGSALTALALEGPRGRPLFLVALTATIVQFGLVVYSHHAGAMTHYGGLTERVIVATLLLWVGRQCAPNAHFLRGQSSVRKGAAGRPAPL